MVFPILGSGDSSSGYNIDNSLRFNNGDSPYLHITPSAGNRKTWTWSAWIKIGVPGVKYGLFACEYGTTAGNSDRQVLRLTLSGELTFTGQGGNLTTSNLLRDHSAWYHIVFRQDTTQSTDTNRMRIYINGAEASYASSNYPDQNDDLGINSAEQHNIGAEVSSPASSHTEQSFFDGYWAEMYFVDGSSLAPSSFGEFDGNSGIWKPKEYTGAYGTNGFYLDFSNNLNTATSTAYDSEWSDDSDTRVLVKSNTSDGSTTFTDTSGAYSLSANGNAHHETDQKKYGTTSMHFDGSGDYISTSNSLVAFGTDDFTVEGWIYPTSTGSTQGLVSAGGDVSNGPFVRFFRNPDGYIYTYPYNSGKPWSGYLTSSIKTEQDEWSHFAFVREGDIWSVFVNGKLGGRLTGSANYDCNSGSGDAFIGRDPHSSGYYFTGYLDEVRISDVARYTQASLSYSSTLGADASGEDNHLVPTNLAATDQTTDTPTNNFATLNPINLTEANASFAEGNLKFTNTLNSAPHHGLAHGTMAVAKGKWYWEVRVDAIGGTAMGIGADEVSAFGKNNVAGNQGISLFNHGYTHQRGSDVAVSGGTTYTTNDIIGVALDMDNRKIYFHKDGAYFNSGDPTSGATGTGAISFNALDVTMTPAVSNYNSGICNVNFGNPAWAVSSSQADDDGYGNFEYDVPTGYYALCTKNLAEYG